METSRVAEIKAKWEKLKNPPPDMSSGAYATAVALFAAMNVDYLIARAEFGEFQAREAGR